MDDVAKWRLLNSKAKELRTLAERLDAGAPFVGQLTGVVIESNQRRRVAEEEASVGTRDVMDAIRDPAARVAFGLPPL